MVEKKNQYIISVMAADRIGIIHDITRKIAAMEGDLTDTRQQVLHGYFSMILYGTFPESVSQQAIREQLLAIEPDNPFEVSVKPVLQKKTNPAPADSYVLTARGADRIGFVALVSGFCVEHGVNILDLSTTGKGETYTMILLVDLENCPSIEILRANLEEFNTNHGLTLLLQHHDIFKATNEIRML